ncbi:hypothetical protein L195_g004290, partial [Trifolium pratense]
MLTHHKRWTHCRSIFWPESTRFIPHSDEGFQAIEFNVNVVVEVVQGKNRGSLVGGGAMVGRIRRPVELDLK